MINQIKYLIYVSKVLKTGEKDVTSKYIRNFNSDDINKPIKLSRIRMALLIYS